MAAFFIFPLGILFAISFATRGQYGGLEWVLTVENYALIADPLYLGVFSRSVVLAFLTTLLCIVLGFPLAYYMARASSRSQGIWLVLIMLPFWTNFLVRTYAWMFILRSEGLLNTALQAMGI